MLSNMTEVAYSPLASSSSFKVSYQNGVSTTKDNHDHFLTCRVHVHDNVLTVTLEKTNASKVAELFLVTVEYFLGHHPAFTRVQVETTLPLDYPANLLGMTFQRSEFYQLPHLWHRTQKYQVTPEKWTVTKEATHPVRPKPFQGVVYKRYNPELRKEVVFRLTDPEKDLDTFHQWHNQPRVSCFWELNFPKEELKAYMEKGLLDPHQTPMIVEVGGEKVGYYEMYWVKEDRLGPYYDSEAYDRGFHFLIGNVDFLGGKITDQIIKSGIHFLYLDEPRTRKIMAEPRHDNQKVLRYAEASIGWTKLKEFDFPHKRAALLENRREKFFEGNAL